MSLLRLPRLGTFCFFVAASARAGVPAADQDQLLREQLRRDYGIQALDKTDRQAPVVLKNFLFLLRHSFTSEFVRSLKDLRYLFAYAGHDRTVDQGAFHWEAKAISIGGILSYPEAGEDDFDPGILATLAHELGHAYLLEKLSPAELSAVGKEFGGWGAVLGAGPVPNFYAKEFFLPHPSYAAVRRAPTGATAGGWKALSLCSRLAAKNIHEWFADAFAAYVLQRLGASGALGSRWRERLSSVPRDPREYWSDYNYLSPEFAAWFDRKLRL